MDRPILHPFVQELRESDRLRAFAEAFPAAARVSEPALPLLLAALRDRHTAARLTVAAVLLTVNWTGYVWAITHDRVLDAALGYFMAPLATMILGVAVLREHAYRDCTRSRSCSPRRPSSSSPPPLATRRSSLS